MNTKFLNTIFDSKLFTSSANSYGKNHETIAKGTYMERNKNIHIHDCGLVVNPSYSFLGASPDGKVCDNGITGILEVKCSYSARDMLLSDAVNMIPKFCLDTNMHLKNHEYYFQVQGQLLVTGPHSVTL